MNLKKAKQLRRLVKLLAYHPKEAEPVIKGQRELIVGFNSDGTERKETFYNITMVYPPTSARAMYKKMKKSLRNREPFPNPSV